MNSHDPKIEQEQNPEVGRKQFLKLEKWEIVLLALSFILIVFFALPNYFYALGDLRGRECTKRLTLLADCLQYLADKNETKPGKKICELFDLNELLEQAQGGGSVKIHSSSDLPLYFKIGTEPDCPEPDGDYELSLFLDEEGNIIPPTCSEAQGQYGEYFREHGLHVVDMSKVDGDPFNQMLAENPENQNDE